MRMKRILSYLILLVVGLTMFYILTPTGSGYETMMDIYNTTSRNDNKNSFAAVQRILFAENFGVNDSTKNPIVNGTNLPGYLPVFTANMSYEDMKSVILSSPNISNERKSVATVGFQLIGVTKYSQDLKPQWENTDLPIIPEYLDCSSFVRWAFRQSGLKSFGTWTGEQVGNCTPIDQSQVMVGDVHFKNTSGVHVLLVIGQNEAGQVMYIHCANKTDHMKISTYGEGFHARPNGIYNE